MKRRMDKDDYRKLGITARKQGDYWEIFFNHLAMMGLSDKDFEIFRQKSAKEAMDILSRI